MNGTGTDLRTAQIHTQSVRNPRPILPHRHRDIRAQLNHEQFEGRLVVGHLAGDAFHGEVAGVGGLEGAGEAGPGEGAGVLHASLEEEGAGAGHSSQRVGARVGGEHRFGLGVRLLPGAPAALEEELDLQIRAGRRQLRYTSGGACFSRSVAGWRR
jgi:hypothetical protein